MSSRNDVADVADRGTTTTGSPIAAAAVLVAGAVVVAAALLLPGWRQPLLVATSFASAGIIAAAVLRRRPAPVWPWLVLAAMMALAGVGVLAARSPADVGPLAATSMVAAQLGAAVVGVHVAFVPALARRRRDHRPPLTDLAIIMVSLGLVGAQLALVASDRGARATTALITPSVDAAFLVLVVVYAVSRARMAPAVVVGIAGACVYLGVDLAVALGGNRVTPPGDALQVAGLAVGILYAASALMPSMTDVFNRAELGLRRSPSSALVRLLPLMAVPLALWAVAHVGGVRGFPAPVLVAAGGVLGAACLVRAATALRSTETMARHDALTGLPNRHGLDLLQASAAVDGEVSNGLVLVDVDDFKNINDTHGHDVGDRALLAIRDRLVAAAGGDAVVGRLGGDEFALLVSLERAHQVSRDVLDALRSPVRVDDLELRVRASVGVALPAAPDEDATGTGFGDGGAGSLSELLTHADVALYAAKAAGRDQVVTYRPQMRVDVAHRFTLCNELRYLLGGGAASAGHLEVHYQVLVELAGEQARGAEALVRWRHPRLGLLAPAAFLELVSVSGLDAALDEAVLREVVDQIARWRSQGRTVAPISVNLTRDSLVRSDLVELVLTLLVDSGVPAALLHLEITEHEALPDDDAIATRLIELDEAGVRIHLDDYGTGYTSMDYLRRFPVRVLKIDRAVTATLDELLGSGPGHDSCSIPSFRGSIVGGLVAMSDALGIDLLAEGVETEEQAAMLRSLGVRYAQGYLYGRPLPAAEHAVATCSTVGRLETLADGGAAPAATLPPGSTRP